MDASKSFFAATGLSKRKDVLAAAGEATDLMMGKFKAAGRTPKAVIFIERVEGIKIYGEDKGKFHIPHDIGALIKDKAGGAKVYGSGGAGTYGITWGDLRDGDSSFIVMGLTGKDLEVDGYADGGILQFSYPGVNTYKGMQAGDPVAWETQRREKVQRAACHAAGAQHAAQIPILRKPGFIFVMGGLHNNWHVTYFNGMRDMLPVRTQMIGGVGQWEDYVYCDGLKLHNKMIAADECVAGRLAVVVQGTDFDCYAMGGESVNKFDEEAIDRHTSDVARRMRHHLEGRKPDALVAFSCVTRLRDPKIMDPAVLTRMMHRHFAGVDAAGSDMELFGCFCGGEVCLTIEGDYTVGGDRLAAVGIVGK